MKKLLLFISIIIYSCSSSGGDDTPVIKEPEDDGIPIAVDDIFNTIEDTALEISDLLDNDDLTDNAKLDSFQTTTTNGGTVSDERLYYLYTPQDGFIGDDTFTYTICDDDEPENCSTATVTITVSDEGNPTAEADIINVPEDKTRIISSLLDNDNAIDDAIINSIDNTLTLGTVVLNSDNTVSYTPQASYLGEDTFTYTICDDDTPTNSCSTATVTINVIESISFNIPAEISGYYNDLLFFNTSGLMYESLQVFTEETHTTILEYTDRHDYLYDADEDQSNTENVILMYSGESRYWQEYQGNPNYNPLTFNTEHVYPQSLLEADNAITDLHHLRVCDATTNTNRSNNAFRDGSGTFGLDNGEWYPGDEWKGDVARMIMYLNVRYGETFEKVGSLELFLKWNIEDPVSSFEEQRNNVIYTAQGNRNAFIDNPYLATLIWGGADAENKWE